MHCHAALPAFCVFLIGASLDGCASQTRLPAPVRAEIATRHSGRTVALRQSMYYGDLYDENEKYLLSPYPFSETFHIVDTHGAPIHPHGQTGIIPAGTELVVHDIEFPDATALAKRMLTTPRYNPWVYLTPTPESAVPKERKYFILLLPMDLETGEAVEQALDKLLGPPEEVRNWLAKRRPTVRVAIEHKDVAVGMTLEEVVASLGQPQRWFNDTRAGKRAKVAWYPSRELWLDNDSVAEIKPGRQVAPIGGNAAKASSTTAEQPSLSAK